MEYGVFITRAQPFHNGHLKVLKKMLAENDRVLLIVGSADMFRPARNPFSIGYRTNSVKNGRFH